MKRLALIGAASGWGAQVLQTELGPDAVKHHHVEQNLKAKGVEAYWRETVYPPQSYREVSFAHPGEALSFVNEENKALAKVVQSALQDNEFPVVIGGDHSIAVGTWGSLIVNTQAVEDFGLIWIDAHMDAHTHETTPSHAYHGMPVAALLGYGEPSFVNSVCPGPKLKPEHVVLMGVRAYEPEEENLLLKLGVRVIKMTEIQQQGFAPLFQEALSVVQKGTKGFGVSIDLDGFDPKLAPGVGSPEPDGLIPHEVLPCFQGLKNNPHFKGMEIMELNPEKDKNHQTTQLVQDILLSTFA